MVILIFRYLTIECLCFLVFFKMSQTASSSSSISHSTSAPDLSPSNNNNNNNDGQQGQSFHPVSAIFISYIANIYIYIYC